MIKKSDDHKSYEKNKLNIKQLRPSIAYRLQVGGFFFFKTFLYNFFLKELPQQAKGRKLKITLNNLKAFEGPFGS